MRNLESVFDRSTTFLQQQRLPLCSLSFSPFPCNNTQTVLISQIMAVVSGGWWGPHCTYCTDSTRHTAWGGKIGNQNVAPSSQPQPFRDDPISSVSVIVHSYLYSFQSSFLHFPLLLRKALKDTEVKQLDRGHTLGWPLYCWFSSRDSWHHNLNKSELW